MGKLVCYGYHSMFDRKGGAPNYLRLGWHWLKLPRFNPLALTDGNKSLIGFNLSFLFECPELLSEAMSDLGRWVNEGRLKPPAVTTFRFDDVADAHRAIESGTTTGKLILDLQ